MNLENIKPNFKTSNVLTTENTFNKDILSTDNHLVENINNHLLTASSQSTPLTLEAEFSSESAKVANSEVTNLKSNFVQPQNFDSTVDLTNSTAAGGFNETPITVNFVDGKTEKRINVPVSNSVLKDNFTGEAALKNQNNSVTVPEASPQSNVNSFNTVKTSNVNNLETNISPMGDDASSLEDTSLSKFEENQVSALSQDKSEYLDSNVLPVQGTVTGGNEEGVLLNSDLQNNPRV
ncbi:MAG: hypothetical protein MJK14_23465, partial [Rivularia sp. ALOHA_DT_140]|nr:hypothetical protein [Rivularia sp. ALOHA_DT_140]